MNIMNIEQKHTLNQYGNENGKLYQAYDFEDGSYLLKKKTKTPLQPNEKGYPGFKEEWEDIEYITPEGDKHIFLGDDLKSIIYTDGSTALMKKEVSPFNLTGGTETIYEWKDVQYTAPDGTKTLLLNDEQKIIHYIDGSSILMMKKEIDSSYNSANEKETTYEWKDVQHIAPDGTITTLVNENQKTIQNPDGSLLLLVKKSYEIKPGEENYPGTIHSWVDKEFTAPDGTKTFFDVDNLNSKTKNNTNNPSPSKVQESPTQAKNATPDFTISAQDISPLNSIHPNFEIFDRFRSLIHQATTNQILK